MCIGGSTCWWAVKGTGYVGTAYRPSREEGTAVDRLRKTNGAIYKHRLAPKSDVIDVC